MTDSPHTLIARARAFVVRHPDGVTTRQAAAALGCTQATVACALARLYWRGVIDRHEAAAEGTLHIYRPRTAHADPAPEVED